MLWNTLDLLNTSIIGNDIVFELFVPHFNNSKQLQKKARASFFRHPAASDTMIR